MNGIFKIVKITGDRTFQARDSKGNVEDVNVVGIILQRGTQDVYVEAYRKIYDKVKSQNVGVGDLVGARLSSYVLERQNNGVTYFSTQFVVDDIVVWLKSQPDHF